MGGKERRNGVIITVFKNRKDEESLVERCLR